MMKISAKHIYSVVLQGLALSPRDNQSRRTAHQKGSASATLLPASEAPFTGRIGLCCTAVWTVLFHKICGSRWL